MLDRCTAVAPVAFFNLVAPRRFYMFFFVYFEWFAFQFPFAAGKSPMLVHLEGQAAGTLAH